MNISFRILCFHIFSEFNNNKTNPLRFIQMWIDPRQRGLKPNYGSMVSSEESIKNTIKHIVSDVNDSLNTPVKVHQDVNIYSSLLEKEHSLQFKVGDNRQVYFLCIEGELKVKYDDHNQNQEDLITHDAAEIKGPITLDFQPQSPACHFLMVEMAKNNDSRF